VYEFQAQKRENTNYIQNLYKDHGVIEMFFFGTYADLIEFP